MDQNEKIEKLENLDKIAKLEKELDEVLLDLNMFISIFTDVIYLCDRKSIFKTVLENFCNYIDFNKAVFLIKENDSYSVLAFFGFDKNSAFGPVKKSESSLIYFINDIHMSLIIPDISKDIRFDENELFAVNELKSVIVKPMLDSKNIYGIFIFYSVLKDDFLLKKSLIS